MRKIFELTPLVLMTLVVAGPVARAGNDEPVSPEQAFEKELEQQAEKLPVMQNRKYQMQHEIAFAVGTLPTDAYFKGLTVGAGYTLHLTEDLAWEIVNFNYSFDFDSHVKQQVLTLAVPKPGQPLSFPQITWFAATHLVVEPLYGKEALGNNSLVHMEVFFLLGPAVVSQISCSAECPAISTATYSFGLDVGVGLRLHLTPVTSVRVDLGDLIYVVQQSAKQALRLSASIAFNLGAGP